MGSSIGGASFNIFAKVRARDDDMVASQDSAGAISKILFGSRGVVDPGCVCVAVSPFPVPPEPTDPFEYPVDVDVGFGGTGW